MELVESCILDDSVQPVSRSPGAHTALIALFWFIINK